MYNLKITGIKFLGSLDINSAVQDMSCSYRSKLATGTECL